MLYYVILQRNMATECVSVLSVFEDKELAEAELECLINESSDEEDFAYKMDTVG